MDGLRQKLETEGLRNVVYMVINHQGEQAQRLHPLLRQKLSENIALYKQDVQQPDVWQTLNGDKDDFLIYDRCGRLTHHISLPYSIIGQGHIENAIKDTYCNRICGDCSHESVETPEECTRKANAQPDTEGTQAGGDEDHHRHHHGHGHHGHHGHHGDNHGVHPRGFGQGHGHGHGHNHGHHSGNHDGSDHGQSQQVVRPQEHDQLDGGSFQSQHNFGSDHMQQAVQIHQLPQQVVQAPVRP